MANSDWAFAAYIYSVERLRTFGSDNKRQSGPGPVLDADGAYAAEVKRVGKKTAMARLKIAQPLRGSALTEIVAFGRTVVAAEAGNCFEHAAAACSFLDIQQPRPTFDVVRMPGLDHAFVVIGQAFPANDGLYPADFAAWHPEAAICDGWAEICCMANDYPAQWNLKMDAWHGAGIEVPHMTQVQGWTSPVNYKDMVQAERKESYSWRRARGCCYITTATCHSFGLPDDCHDLTALRWFRDNVMLASPEGVRDVARYYDIAPSIVAAIDATTDARAIYRDIYQRFIVPSVTAVDRGEHDNAHRLFAALVAEMSSRFSSAPVADRQAPLLPLN